MVKIRLSRIGARNQPTYRIVAVDSQKKRDGRNLEILGFYDPKTQPASFKIKSDRLDYWLKKGAQLTLPVRKILENGKIA